jgi:hypothetical protein
LFGVGGVLPINWLQFNLTYEALMNRREFLGAGAAGLLQRPYRSQWVHPADAGA